MKITRRTPPFVLTALVMLASLAMPATSIGVTPPATDAALRSAVNPSDRRLDALTLSCLDCHDGAQAQFIAARQAGTPTRYDGHRGQDHPIGMRYRDYPERDPASYRYLLTLDPSIRLIEGKVACVSCHRLKSEFTQEAYQVLANLGGDRRTCVASKDLARDARTNSLCLACHVM